MKMKLPIVALLGLLFPLALLAQDAAPVASAPVAGNWVTWLTPIITPFVLMLVKKFLPLLPSGLIPVLAPLLGVALDLINSFATAHQGNVVLAAILGLAGVGVREVKEAVKKADNGGWKPTGANP
jgi:hypothetical protein